MMKSDRTIPFGHLREAQTEVPPDCEALPRDYRFCPLMRPPRRRLRSVSPNGEGAEQREAEEVKGGECRKLSAMSIACNDKAKQM